MRQALRAVDGVVDAEVSYDDGRATVKYDPALVDPDRLVEAVNDSGFTARLSNDAPTEQGEPTETGAPARQR